MDKHEHVVTMSTGTKERVDNLICVYKAKFEIIILEKLLEVGGIDTGKYVKELMHIYAAMNGRIL